MESLREKQSRFAKAIPRLIDYAYSQGYELTFGEAWRADAQAEINALGTKGRNQLATMIQHAFNPLASAIRRSGNGIKLSLHCSRLAFDFNVFKDGKIVPFPVELGAYWESLGDDHRWGGRWGDFPHVSIQHEGRK
jgi:hypothetical protein